MMFSIKATVCILFFDFFLIGSKYKKQECLNLTQYTMDAYIFSNVELT